MFKAYSFKYLLYSREHEAECDYMTVECPNNAGCPPLLKKVRHGTVCLYENTRSRLFWLTSIIRPRKDVQMDEWMDILSREHCSLLCPFILPLSNPPYFVHSCFHCQMLPTLSIHSSIVKCSLLCPFIFPLSNAPYFVHSFFHCQMLPTLSIHSSIVKCSLLCPFILPLSNAQTLSIHFSIVKCSQLCPFILPLSNAPYFVHSFFHCQMLPTCPSINPSISPKSSHHRAYAINY